MHEPSPLSKLPSLAQPSLQLAQLLLATTQYTYMYYTIIMILYLGSQPRGYFQFTAPHSIYGSVCPPVRYSYHSQMYILYTHDLARRSTCRRGMTCTETVNHGCTYLQLHMEERRGKQERTIELRTIQICITIASGQCLYRYMYVGMVSYRQRFM